MILLPYSAYYRLMRLDKPVGIWLLLWPCWWSVTLAAGELRPDLLALFFLGAVAMRSAGCIINDITDRRIDAQVERTKLRPIASGEVSVGEGMALVFLLLTLSLAIALMLGWEVVKLAFVWLLPVMAYPWMKRLMGWPQLFLGLTFNAGAIMGWVAVRGTVEWPAIFLYLGSICWTLGYDTIYAHQDKKDDSRLGVHSTALAWGRHTKRWVLGFYSLFVFFLGLCGVRLHLPALYFCFLAAVCTHLLWQVAVVRLEDPQDCRRVFRSNQWTGALIFLVILSVTSAGLNNWAVLPLKI